MSLLSAFNHSKFIDKNFFSSLLSPQSILNDLFGEKDEGDDSPNISNEIALERLGFVASSFQQS